MLSGSWGAWWHRTLRTFGSHAGPGRERRSRRFTPRLERLEDRRTPAVVNLAPVADNTLYEIPTAALPQQKSNGVGQHFYVGDTNAGANARRRGALKFDLSAIPAG